MWRGRGVGVGGERDMRVGRAWGGRHGGGRGMGWEGHGAGRCLGWEGQGDGRGVAWEGCGGRRGMEVRGA